MAVRAMIDGTVIDDDNPLAVEQQGVMPLPLGAATLAEQQTQTTALQTIDNLVALLNALASVATDQVRVDVISQPGGETYGTADDDHATVGVASGGILPADPLRLFAIIVNDSAHKVWLGFGAAAVVGDGVMLAPNGHYLMSPATNNLWLDTVNGISLNAGCNVSYHVGTA